MLMQGAHCHMLTGGIDMQFATLGMASPVICSEIGALDSHSFMAKMAEGL